MLFAQKISEDQAFQIILNNDKNIHAQKNVLYYPSPISPKKELINTKNLKSPDFISWFFFVDEFPNQSWEHPCYYAFVNSNTGEYIKIEATLPPDLEELKVKVMQPMPEPGKLFNFTKKDDGLKSATTHLRSRAIVSRG